jgi:hypothetical protein
MRRKTSSGAEACWWPASQISRQHTVGRVSRHLMKLVALKTKRSAAKQTTS